MKNVNLKIGDKNFEVSVSFVATDVADGLQSLGNKSLPTGSANTSLDRTKFNLLLNKTLLCEFNDSNNKKQEYLSIPVVSFHYDSDTKQFSGIVLNRLAVSTAVRLSEFWQGANPQRYDKSILGITTSDELSNLMKENAVFVADAARKIIPFKLSKIDGSRVYYSAEGQPLLPRDEYTFKKVDSVPAEIKAKIVEIGLQLLKEVKNQ